MAARSKLIAAFQEIEFPGVNHLFQPCKTGSPTEYVQIEMTIAPEILKVIGDWIAEKVGSH